VITLTEWKAVEEEDIGEENEGEIEGNLYEPLEEEKEEANEG